MPAENNQLQMTRLKFTLRLDFVQKWFINFIIVDSFIYQLHDLHPNTRWREINCRSVNF